MGRAAPADVAGHGLEILDVQHLHLLFPQGLGRLFQVQLLGARQAENPVSALFALGHQGFEQPFRFKTEQVCGVHAG